MVFAFLGGGGGGGLVSSVTYGDDDNTPTPLWYYFCHIKFPSEKNVSDSPIPPPPPPRLSVVFRAGAISGGSRICEKGGPGIQIPPCRARPEKVAHRGRGGGGGGELRHIFFPEFHLRNLHYRVGVPSAYQIDLPGEKKKERKIMAEKRVGGGGGISIVINHKFIRPSAISMLWDFSLSQNGQPILAQPNFHTL